ncbi:MAG: hypothetical protein J5943_07385 [Oribacterium sp.]|nr:hypothetical protein [Oribacterium sp.]
MRKNRFKNFAVIAAAGMTALGLSICSYAAPQGGEGGGFSGGNTGGRSEVSAPSNRVDDKGGREVLNRNDFSGIGDSGKEMAAPADRNGGINAFAFNVNTAGNAIYQQNTETPPEAPVDENGNPMAPLDNRNGQGQQNTETPPEAPVDENGNPMAPLDNRNGQGQQNTETPPEAPVDENGNPMAPLDNRNGQGQQNTETPPEAPVDENGNPMAPLDNRNGQGQQMKQNAPENITKLIESISDEEQKSELEELYEALQTALEKEKAAINSGEETDGDSRSELHEAVEKARKALDDAVKTYLDSTSAEDTSDADSNS